MRSICKTIMTLQLTDDLNEPSRRQLWLAAIKLPLYSVIINPEIRRKFANHKIATFLLVN